MKLPINNFQFSIFNFQKKARKLLHNNRGFTLIELLVVIAILAILAAIALTSYNSAQKSARDGRRRSDLEQYRIALQNYATNNKGLFPYNNCGTKLASCPVVSCAGNSFSTTGLFDGGGCDGNITTAYLPAVIADPLNTSVTNAYYYIQSTDGSTGSTYVLHTKLENSSNYWVVCSDGRSGTATAAPTTSVCPTLQ